MTVFDLNSISGSVTKLRAVIPADAFTAAILGSERVGSGVVIDSAGLILTIGAAAPGVLDGLTCRQRSICPERFGFCAAATRARAGTARVRGGVGISA